PKTFAVLCCLVTQAGQLVTKDTLLEAVWPETVVSEAVVTVAIRALRRVLGDRAHTPRFIETVRGRGYRFVAPVSPLVAPGGRGKPICPFWRRWDVSAGDPKGSGSWRCCGSMLRAGSSRCWGWCRLPNGRCSSGPRVRPHRPACCAS